MGQGFYGFPNILGLLRGTNLKVLGKAGATAGAGLAGGTTSGAPTSGQFDVADVIVTGDGTFFICVAAGSPGTFTRVGAQQFTWATKTADYVLATTDSGVLLNASGGDHTATLPTAVGSTQLYAVGRTLDGGAHLASVLTTGGQTIGGFATVPLQPGQVYVLGSDGANWDIYSSYYPSPLTTLGDVVVADASGLPQRLGAGSNGKVLTANSGAPLGVDWETISGTTLTTKGDVQGYSTVPARVPVGANGYVLTADSTASLGVGWQAPTAAQPSSLLVLLPNPYDFVSNTSTDYGQPPDFILTAAGDCIGVGGG